MYAVVATGGKQIRLSEGDVVRVEKMDVLVGDMVELSDVRLLAKDDGLEADSQALANAKVVCEVIGQGRAKKIRVFKKKRRKNYARTQGHRQAFTQLKVRQIQA